MNVLNRKASWLFTFVKSISALDNQRKNYMRYAVFNLLFGKCRKQEPKYMKTGLWGLEESRHHVQI